MSFQELDSMSLRFHSSGSIRAIKRQRARRLNSVDGDGQLRQRRIAFTRDAAPPAGARSQRRPRVDARHGGGRVADGTARAAGDADRRHCAFAANTLPDAPVKSKDGAVAARRRGRERRRDGSDVLKSEARAGFDRVRPRPIT